MWHIKNQLVQGIQQSILIGNSSVSLAKVKTLITKLYRRTPMP